ncbi:MAG: hypothetical protein GY906_32320 [bacterium]|nr:hypothetical protein [bacterium]
MMQTQADRTVLRAVELMADGLRGDRSASDALVGAIQDCIDAGAPDFFVTSGLSIVHEFVCLRKCSSPDECLLPGPAELREKTREANHRRLSYLREHVTASGILNGRPPVLLGDGATLLGLYSCMGAFPGSLWIAGIARDTLNGEPSATLESLTAAPAEIRVAPCGALTELLDDCTQEITLDGQSWLVPTGELLIALLAARVGDPESTPLPPVWVHLALAMARFGDTIDHGLVHGITHHLGLDERAQRGFAVGHQLIPSILESPFVDSAQLPFWERKLAVPLAAKRLLREAMSA